ncbi:MAG TPA: adenylate/guanylate cyclase domain-containing protein [Gaiellaceae bacterium]|nr:adenylate/guanylate cyclase domain-containing protein [Gaiellaceae bacterium]
MREQRKVVTVLFCDVVGSTALGESTDPEALRARMRGYFEDLRSIVERHGGVVEKFVGDAVMAVFGIPASHEDDALRAVRAASEMRVAIVEHGLEARIGVNTGEVVVGGEAETLVTGDAVNVAARLEQAAASGEALIGAQTRLLVRDAVRVEAVEPPALKGKSAPVEAYRLLEVLTDAAPLARHLETPLVGRERERRRLWRDYEDAVADSTCRLFTLLGPAGIGKSRLVADVLERVGDSADVHRGRCLPYGEGITYWPLVEILIAIGSDPESVIGSSPAETQLAFRRLLESRAVDRPQVVVIDDLQWAEPVFIDLVEHVADLSRDVPIFLLCVARTELLDVRPDWGGGKLNATSLLLEPLGAEDCIVLIEHLVEGPLDDALRARITASSAGNPLYVEEMLAMVREHGGDGEIAVPPTIHALLQARIDSLEGDVRVVMERGAVEGEVFHRGSVALLSPDPVRSAVESHLQTLVRKELIRSTSPTFPEDEGFRFRHLLIRDAAYESLPKATRAELHERFADWLSTHDLIERDEIVGYHLEQAQRYRAELNGSDPALDGLARRASAHLAAAGQGALERGDFNAGRSLFARATTLLPDGDEARLALAPAFADALFEVGEEEDTWRMLSEAAQAADPATRARATVTMATWALFGEHEMPSDQREAWRNEARAVFESTGDDYGLALYWSSVAWEAWFLIRANEAAQACEHALEHFHRAGAERSRPAASMRARLRGSYYQGPTPVDEAIERIEALGAGEYGLLEEASQASVLSRLYAMKGAIAQARELLVRGARQAYLEAGLLQSSGGMTLGDAEVEFRAGDFAAEERVLREGLEVLGAIGDSSYYPTVAAVLAECLYRQGAEDAEIEELCDEARETTGADDLSNFVWLDMVTGMLHARRGDHTEANRLTLSAVALADTADFHFPRTNSRIFRAEALARAGRHDDAARTAAEAFEMFEAKGDAAGAAQFRAYLSSFGLG